MIFCLLTFRSRAAFLLARSSSRRPAPVASHISPVALLPDVFPLPSLLLLPDAGLFFPAAFFPARGLLPPAGLRPVPVLPPLIGPVSDPARSPAAVLPDARALLPPADLPDAADLPPDTALPSAVVLPPAPALPDGTALLPDIALPSAATLLPDPVLPSAATLLPILFYCPLPACRCLPAFSVQLPSSASFPPYHCHHDPYIRTPVLLSCTAALLRAKRRSLRRSSPETRQPVHVRSQIILSHSSTFHTTLSRKVTAPHLTVM